MNSILEYFLKEQSFDGIVGYHGTTKKIETVPDFLKSMKTMDYGPGFYFAADPEDTTPYGPILYRATVSLKNPIMITPDQEDEKLVKTLQRALRISDMDLEFTEHKTSEIWGFVNELINMGTLSPIKLNEFLKKVGWDGTYIDKRISNSKGDYFAVFDPSQITNWELVSTYGIAR